MGELDDTTPLTYTRVQHAPAFTVLADPQGNKVCVTTGLGRD